MFKPIKLKCVRSGQVLGGGEDMPYPSERIIKKEPGTNREGQFPDRFRPADGSKIELVANNVGELKRFIVENTYEDLFGELGNRCALTDFEATEYQLSGHWVITATMWPMEPNYVRASTLSYPSSRVTSGFQAETTEVQTGPGLTPTAPEGTSGEYVLVGLMGDQGISQGAHFHLDEFPDSKWQFMRQIPPTGAPGRPSDIAIRVGMTKTFELGKSWIFGTQPGFAITPGQGYGYSKRRGRVHHGVDCTSPAQFIFCPKGTYKTQTGVTGYGTYIWCGRFGIGHADLLTPSGDLVPGLRRTNFKANLASNLSTNLASNLSTNLSTRLGFGEAGLNLNSYSVIAEPLDDYGTQSRFAV